MNPQLDNLVRRTTVAATLTASYFLVTSDYGPEFSALDPIKNAILSAEQSVKTFFFGPSKESQGETEKQLSSSNAGKLSSSNVEKHP